MDLQEQLEIGHQAEAFLKYTSEHPYFEGLLERVKLELSAQMLSLRPEQRDEFSSIVSEMLGVSLVKHAIHGDIFLGGEAFKQLSGIIDENKGLL